MRLPFPAAPKRPLLAASFAVLAASILAVTAYPPTPALAGAPATTKTVDWPVYGGSKTGDRYSPLTQITPANVKKLQVAWTYDTGETTGLQTHPLIVGRTLFAYTPSQKVVALDAATGKQLWSFDSGIRTGQPDRGFSFWTSVDGRSRILFAQTLYALWALNPDTGKPIETFGNKGCIDLRNNLGAESPAGTVAITTPGTVYKDLIIMGFRTGEAEPSPHGDIRAYDVHTGAMRWSFHTIPHPGEPGYETWPKDAWKYTGGANNWTGGVLDEKRGIFYAPTGSAVTDFYGADRIGDDLYANSLLALDANTGKLLWHFQAVHHDLWDRDFPAPPVLLTLKHDGKMVDAIAQTTKHGQIFVFDRVSGKPLFPIEEKPFPASTTPGEVASPTQPMSVAIEPYARQRLTADMLTQRTPEAHAWAVKEFGTFISDGQFVPLSVGRQTVIFPGFDGGAEWGGEAADPRTGVMYLNANDIAWTGGLTEVTAAGLGAATYGSQCAACHGADRKGQPPTFPSLIDAGRTLTPEQMTTVIHDGRGRMPSFSGLGGETLTALLAFVRTGKEPEGRAIGVTGPAQPLPVPDRSDKEELPPGSSSTTGPVAKFRFTGYRKFLDPDGYPAIAGPWGTFSAVDLNTGKYLWKVPLGQYPELAAKGMKDTGSENYGGPVLTASGLLFIGATNFDNKMRAFDAKSGRLLWEYTMDFAGNATPATYMVDGKQYVVIATSSARNPKAKQGARYVAFALP
ncbi:PQQ-binding-like beta-propeller repeat protein [Terriglobus roseus]|uniref:Quinoprotein glucose dehydrogenase n=1 Tax=Terriglobus roseus TaxID=392734 RepID=A0A1H4RVR6_9BACT|nr:PQQ-binding-like beta-propeller repeat protein [Terriglobus roseus]SEC35898.1 quinoprotein glucose dehydrogenase [Terriglobus roseus]